MCYPEYQKPAPAVAVKPAKATKKKLPAKKTAKRRMSVKDTMP